jgi:hypothetical protein
MAKNLKPVIVLFGGLGNQLFQYAFALSKFGPNGFMLEGNLGKPRKSDGKPDLFQFNIKSELILSKNSVYTKLMSNIFLFILKLSSVYSIREKYINFFLAVIEKIFFYYDTNDRIFRRLYIARGTGYFTKNNESLSYRSTVIGNFHTYVWASEPRIEKILKQIELLVVPHWLQQLQLLSKIDQPCAVQIRQGDYLNNKELGFLNLNYFYDLVNKIQAEDRAAKFWIFSDSYGFISKSLPIPISKQSLLIDFEVKNSAANLIALTYASKFIISNSTFGWWGAYLANLKHESKVFTPSQFYKHAINPHYLYPPEWQLVSII